jgi:hypothetical protein
MFSGLPYPHTMPNLKDVHIIGFENIMHVQLRIKEAVELNNTTVAGATNLVCSVLYPEFLLRVVMDAFKVSREAGIKKLHDIAQLNADEIF